MEFCMFLILNAVTQIIWKNGFFRNREKVQYYGRDFLTKFYAYMLDFLSQ